jgi:hypothetical protein
MKDFFINKSQIDNRLSPKLIVIKTQLKYQLFTQLTIDMHLVHGILKILQLQPTALLLPEIDFPNNQSSKSLKSDLMKKLHHSSKFLNKLLVTITRNKTFDQENLITERLLFTIRIAHSKAETQEHPTFWTICI